MMVTVFLLLRINTRHWYESLRPKPTIVRDTKVRPAGEGAGMTAQYLGDLNLRIGAYDFAHPLYVGPLQDKMLLGIDFLRTQGAEVSCEAGTLKVRGIATPFELSTGVPVSVIEAVSTRRVQIPSHTAHIIECDLESDMPDFILEPASIFPHGIVASKTYNSAGTHARLCVLNMTDSSFIIKKGTKFGEATSASSVQSVDPVVRSMALRGENNYDHLTKLLEDLQINALAEVRDSAVSLVKDNANICLPRVVTWCKPMS